MAGITQGEPDLAVGEPIRLGNNDEFEIEHHPISDRLIIRDTVNGKVAYVRKDEGGQIGGDGRLVEALKNDEPMADDGRTYPTIQEAERNASTWVFVPPATFNESVTIETDGLTLRGCGYNTLISLSSSNNAVTINADNVSIKNLSIKTTDSNSDCIASGSDTADDLSVENITFRDAGYHAMFAYANVNGINWSVINCRVETCNRGFALNNGSIVKGCIVNDGSNNIFLSNKGNVAESGIVANNIVSNGGDGIETQIDTTIIVGNRVQNNSEGIVIVGKGDDCLVANNRIADSTTAIDDNSGTALLDGNLTGASN
jgi:parallel beta-helix repeat protein